MIQQIVCGVTTIIQQPLNFGDVLATTNCMSASMALVFRKARKMLRYSSDIRNSYRAEIYLWKPSSSAFVINLKIPFISYFHYYRLHFTYETRCIFFDYRIEGAVGFDLGLLVVFLAQNPVRRQFAHMLVWWCARHHWWRHSWGRWTSNGIHWFAEGGRRLGRSEASAT